MSIKRLILVVAILFPSICGAQGFRNIKIARDGKVLAVEGLKSELLASSAVDLLESSSVTLESVDLPKEWEGWPGISFLFTSPYSTSLLSGDKFEIESLTVRKRPSSPFDFIVVSNGPSGIRYHSKYAPHRAYSMGILLEHGT